MNLKNCQEITRHNDGLDLERERDKIQDAFRHTQVIFMVFADFYYPIHSNNNYANRSTIFVE